MKRDPIKKPLSEGGITDADVYEAMKDITGFLDITPGDFKELYRHAYSQALRRISTTMVAKDIMTTQVLSATGDTPLGEVAREMAARGVAGLPVLGAGGKVEGVISEKDFIAKMGGGPGSGFMSIVADCLSGGSCVAIPVRRKLARHIMSTPAVTIGPDTTLREMAALLTEKRVNRLPVVDGEGRLLGIVTRADVLRASGTTGIPEEG